MILNPAQARQEAFEAAKDKGTDEYYGYAFWRLSDEYARLWRLYLDLEKQEKAISKLFTELANQPADCPEDYPQIIRQLRSYLGDTQQKFASRTGVSFATVNRWENGRSRPSLLGWMRIKSLVNKMESDKSP